MTQLRKPQELMMFKQGVLTSCERLTDSDSGAYSSENKEAMEFMDYLRSTM